MEQISLEVIETGSIGQLIERSASNGDLIMIDIPIGLAESQPRRCDLAARRYLGMPRASSVFPPPCRSAIGATDYSSACALNVAACGRKISRQAFNILPRIRQVDLVMTAERQQWVRECHPEVLFARLSGGGRGLPTNKKEAAGRAERRTLLETMLGPIDVDGIREHLRRARVSVDDLLDSLACLIAARHVLDGVALVLPENTAEFDSRGLRMEIVA